MTSDHYRFNQLSPRCSKATINNANNVSSLVVRVATISLSPILSIKDVLFVLLIDYNFLSVKKKANQYLSSLRQRTNRKQPTTKDEAYLICKLKNEIKVKT